MFSTHVCFRNFSTSRCRSSRRQQQQHSGATNYMQPAAEPEPCRNRSHRYKNPQFSRYIFLQLCSPPNKRSFMSPGGFGRGLALRCWAKICARELASVASRCLLGASRCLPLTTGRTVDVAPKFQIRHWDQSSNVKEFCP